VELGEELKKIMLAGIGAVAMTAEKGGQLIEELVKKGQITVGQGKVLNEELKRNMVRKVRDHLVDKPADSPTPSQPLTEESLRSVLGSMNLASRDELDQINRRLEALEKNHEAADK